MLLFFFLITRHDSLVRKLCSELFVNLIENGKRKYLPPPAQVAVPISVQLRCPCPM